MLIHYSKVVGHVHKRNEFNIPTKNGGRSTVHKPLTTCTTNHWRRQLPDKLALSNAPLTKHKPTVPQPTY